MREIINLVDAALKLFAFGLFVRSILSWVTVPGVRKVEQYMDKFYNPFLTPVRKVVKPLQLNSTPPSFLDLAPLVLMLLIWWFVHPFAMWLLGETR